MAEERTERTTLSTSTERPPQLLVTSYIIPFMALISPQIIWLTCLFLSLVSVFPLNSEL